MADWGAAASAPPPLNTPLRPGLIREKPGAGCYQPQIRQENLKSSKITYSSLFTIIAPMPCISGWGGERLGRVDLCPFPRSTFLAAPWTGKRTWKLQVAVLNCST